MNNNSGPEMIPVEEFVAGGKQRAATEAVFATSMKLMAQAQYCKQLGVKLKFKATTADGTEVFIDKFEIHLDPNGIMDQETKSDV